MKNNKGLSPVIATVLLVAIVVVMGLAIFLIFRGMVKEAVTKFDQNIELTCSDVQFNAEGSGGSVTLTNNGNVPIYDFEAKIENDAGHTTQKLSDNSDWPKGGLLEGDSADISNLEGTIILTPVLLGSSDSGLRTFTCGSDVSQTVSA